MIFAYFRLYYNACLCNFKCYKVPTLIIILLSVGTHYIVGSGQFVNAIQIITIITIWKLLINNKRDFCFNFKCLRKW